jgi:hypothetical protein
MTCFRRERRAGDRGQEEVKRDLSNLHFLVFNIPRPHTLGYGDLSHEFP